MITFPPPSVKAGIEKQPCLSDFQEKEQLGKGSFGRVFLGHHIDSNISYAIKEMSKKKNMGKYINKELEIMYSVYSKHIVRLYSHFEDSNNVYFVMEYCQGGNLYTLKKTSKNEKLDEKRIVKIINGLVSSLNTLHNHSPPIVHRDLKLENVLLDANDEIKLTDFGWSNFLVDEELRETYCGTFNYMPPEIISGQKQDHNVDIWCLGVLLYEISTGKLPFLGNNLEVTRQIQSGKIYFPHDLDFQLKDLISKLLKVNPKGRMQLKEVLMHPYVVDGNRKYKLVKENLVNGGNGSEELSSSKQVLNGVMVEYILNKNMTKQEKQESSNNSLNLTNNNKTNEKEGSKTMSNMKKESKLTSKDSNILSLSLINYKKYENPEDLKLIISKLINENTQLKSELEQNNKESIEKQLLKLRKELEEKYSESINLKNELHSLKQKASEYEFIMKTQLNNIDFFNEELKEKDQIIIDLKNELQNVNDEYFKLKNEIRNKSVCYDKSKIDYLEMVNSLQYENDKKNSLLKISQIEIEQLKKDVLQAETRTATYYNKIIIDYENELREKEFENSRLMMKIKVQNSNESDEELVNI